MNFIQEFANDFARHPAVARFNDLFETKSKQLDSWFVTSPHALIITVPLALGAMLVVSILASYATSWSSNGLPDAPIAIKEVKKRAEELKPSSATPAAPSSSSASGKQPGEKGAPSFAQVAAQHTDDQKPAAGGDLPAAHAGEGGAPSFAEVAAQQSGGDKTSANGDDLPAAHAGEGGAPSFAEVAKESDGVKKRK